MEAGYDLTNYTPPPEDWMQPSHCEECDQVIIFSCSVSGYPDGIWTHLPGPYTHDVVIGRWWDTRTGTFKEGAAA